MTIYKQLTWPVADLAAVCALQNVAGDGPLIMNGTLANPFTPNELSFIANGFTRTISITSANNLSGAIFTVIGFQNGAPILEEIDGPNNDTVFSENAFDIVTSVLVDEAVNGVRVGTGNTGYLPLISVNNLTNTNIINYGIQTRLNVTPHITYDVLFTLFNISNNGLSYDDLNTLGYFIAYESDETTNLAIGDNKVVNSFLIHITASEAGDVLNCIYSQV